MKPLAPNVLKKDEERVDIFQGSIRQPFTTDAKLKTFQKTQQ